MSLPYDFGSVMDIRQGRGPVLDALLLHFMTENGLEHSIDPSKNASPEQVRFVVACKDEHFYAPCSDWMLFNLLESEMTPELQEMYLEQWRSLVRLTKHADIDRYVRRKILRLARHKFQMAMDACIAIPSRVMKRLITIFLSQSGIDDPHLERKREATARAQGVFVDPRWDAFINRCPDSIQKCVRMDEMRFELDFREIQRLICASALRSFKDKDAFFKDCENVESEIEAHADVFTRLHKALSPEQRTSLKILFLPDLSGGLVFDVALIRALLRRGHRVVIALKEGFYFDAPMFWDVEQDPILRESFRGARMLSDVRMSKNDLLQEMREHPFAVISDGSRERFNPYRTSVTLARTWKEADLVIAKGEENYRRLLLTSHEFTRDVFCYFRDESNKLRMHLKAKAEWAIKFPEAYILAKANEIIGEMKQARAEGNTVMFFSGVIGSIPGQVPVAIEVMNALTAEMRDRLDRVYIINPAEHFEEGMDADDLMYMWEEVQRSGYIQIWRFQSVADIEKGFELLGRKVPPIWAGKDATYSTGCTKEMNIALGVQRSHPELQIIGPSPDKFFRRREYGVGKFCDADIQECNDPKML